MYWRRKYNFNVNELSIDSINMNHWIKNKSSLTDRIKKIANLKIKLVSFYLLLELEAQKKYV